VESGLEHVLQEVALAREAGRAFREFALGFNPLLAIPEHEDWIPYYGYGAGVVRLSLGDNSELGGEVGGGYVRLLSMSAGKPEPSPLPVPPAGCHLAIATPRKASARG
jgi:hypothetical protein